MVEINYILTTFFFFFYKPWNIIYLFKLKNKSVHKIKYLYNLFSCLINSLKNNFDMKNSHRIYCVSIRQLNKNR